MLKKKQPCNTNRGFSNAPHTWIWLIKCDFGLRSVVWMNKIEFMPIIMNRAESVLKHTTQGQNNTFLWTCCCWRGIHNILLSQKPNYFMMWNACNYYSYSTCYFFHTFCRYQTIDNHWSCLTFPQLGLKHNHIFQQ